MGHLDAASGITGLIKTVLALEHEALPATLNFEQANPACGFDGSPFFVNSRLILEERKPPAPSGRHIARVWRHECACDPRGGAGRAEPKPHVPGISC